MALDIETFGDQLIETKDLDPIYVAIYGANLGLDQTIRLLLTYWCFYDLGVAAFMSEQEDRYWHWMYKAAANVEPKPGGGRWPRQPERRHFRGKKCQDAIEWLARKSPVERVSALTQHPLTDVVVMKRVQEWPMFGPWIAFKAADMLERCLDVPVNFSENIGLIYSEPRSALDILCNLRPLSPEHHYQLLLSTFANYQAPPSAGRPCGPQEVETVLCKWKAHYRGHYWVGKDIHETRKSLLGWGTNETARKLLASCPAEVGDASEHQGERGERQVHPGSSPFRLSS